MLFIVIDAIVSVTGSTIHKAFELRAAGASALTKSEKRSKFREIVVPLSLFVLRTAVFIGWGLRIGGGFVVLKVVD